MIFCCDFDTVFLDDGLAGEPFSRPVTKLQPTSSSKGANRITVG